MRPCNNLINTPPTLGSKGSEKTTEGRHPLGFLLSGPGAILSGRQSPPGGPDSASRFPRRYTIPFIALLAALTLGLLFLLPGGLLQAQDNGPIMYAENGMGPVATYTAVDPEMTEIVSWSLDGTDAGVFDINDGVLTFKKSPDYEMPADVASTTDDSTAAVDDNMYEVTVQATDSTMKTGMKKVMVEVADVDEMGMVTLSARRPQSEVAFTATPTDPDGGLTGITWQWAKSMEMDGTFVDIEGADSATYTPADADIEYYLRATAMYTDNEGSGKSAMAMPDYSVQGEPARNSAPDFTGQDEDDQTTGIQVTRSVAENTAAGQSVGAPVRGTDGNNDILTYTLSGSNDDDDLFDINWGTGQIMTKSDLNLEDALPTEMSLPKASNCGSRFGLRIRLGTPRQPPSSTLTAPRSRC